MAYNYITKYTSPNQTKGRSSKIDKLVIHWWGDPNQHPTFTGVVNWLCSPKSQASAHYVISGTGRQVACLVDCKDTAWHAGNWAANSSGIGIELDPRCRPEDYDVAAEVIAELWKTYGKLPLFPHRQFSATQCPGSYDLGRLKALAEIKLNPPKPAPVNPHRPVPAAVKMDNPRTMIAVASPTNLWDLNTNPNYKSVKTFKPGDKLGFYGKIDFNGTRYLQTKYSFGKNGHGINIVDLKEIPTPTTKNPEPKPNPAPTPEINYSKENHGILKQILELVKRLVDKISKVFK